MKNAIVNKKDVYTIEQRWLNIFACVTKVKTGKYLPNNFKWENFSQDHDVAEIGTMAFELYKEQSPEDFYLFNENLSQVWECVGEPYPENSPDGSDWYVLPKSELWTAVLSHSGDLYFARNET